MIGDLIFSVALSFLIQGRGTDAERANSGDWNRVTGQFVYARYPSRYLFIVVVFVVVLLFGSLFVSE